MEHVNGLLNKELNKINRDEEQKIVAQLIKRLEIEFRKKDKSGIYGTTQYLLAYNSNRIEGSRLTEKQTLSLFETGTVIASGEIIRAKDVEEATGHFMMFNEMLSTYKETLQEELIKKYHFRLKSGVFEDLANGYPVGEYKNRVNRVADIKTALPSEVSAKMKDLIQRYNEKTNIDLGTLAEFHLEYERIHPFQDGNGRTGRILLFKECLKNGIMPFIIRDEDKLQYYMALQKNDKHELKNFFALEQKNYYKLVQEFLMVYIPKKDTPKESRIPKI